jgi:hypothetical protein
MIVFNWNDICLFLLGAMITFTVVASMLPQEEIPTYSQEVILMNGSKIVCIDYEAKNSFFLSSPSVYCDGKVYSVNEVFSVRTNRR